MSTALKRPVISVEDYLAGELTSPIKHEYLGGFVYAMAGARYAHILIATNVVSALHARLRGKKCRALNSDAKIRVSSATQIRFYYPDASVHCRPNPHDDSFQEEPNVVVEVLSNGTRRIDEGEKRDAYLTIPSLSAYILLEQESATAVVFRRTKDGFVREDYEGMNAVIPLGEIDAMLPLAEAYEGVEFGSESDSSR